MSKIYKEGLARYRCDGCQRLVPKFKRPYMVRFADGKEIATYHHCGKAECLTKIMVKYGGQLAMEL